MNERDNYDPQRFVVLIVGVVLMAVMVSGIVIPILSDLDDGLSINRTNSDYTIMADLMGPDNDIAQGDVISCTILPEGTIHTELVRHTSNNPNTDQPYTVWEETQPCPDIIVMWQNGAVVNLGDSLGIVGFDQYNQHGYTSVKDTDITLHISTTGRTLFDIVLMIGPLGPGPTTAMDIGPQQFVYIPRVTGDYAYYDLTTPVYFNDIVTLVSIGHSGSTAAYDISILDGERVITDTTPSTVEKVEPYINSQNAGYFDTTGDNPHELTVIRDADDVRWSKTFTASRVNDAYCSLTSADITVNGIGLDTWALAKVSYSIGDVANADTIHALMWLCPLLLVMVAIMAIVYELRLREGDGDRPRNVSKKKEREMER